MFPASLRLAAVSEVQHNGPCVYNTTNDIALKGRNISAQAEAPAKAWADNANEDIALKGRNISAQAEAPAKAWADNANEDIALKGRDKSDIYFSLPLDFLSKTLLNWA
jgi:hypothetical protein